MRTIQSLQRPQHCWSRPRRRVSRHRAHTAALDAYASGASTTDRSGPYYYGPQDAHRTRRDTACPGRPSVQPPVQPRAEPAVSGSPVRRSGQLVTLRTKTPAAMPGLSLRRSLLRAAHILSSFLALPSKISARSVVADRRGLEPLGAERVVDVRPVHREHDALDAHLGDRAGQRRIGERAAGRQPEVRLVIVG